MTKVAIEDRRNDEIRISELRTGDCFVNNDGLFMLTDEYLDVKRKAVCLDSGILEYFEEDTDVEKVNSITISFT